MKRDMDLVREILLAFEQSEKMKMPAPKVENYSREQIAYHFDLLLGAEFIRVHTSQRYSRNAKMAYDHIDGYDLTWNGHEFLETIRDPEIWKKTKSGASQIGSWTVGLLADLAKAYAIQKAKDLGLPV